jgi:protein subunit release factor B
MGNQGKQLGTSGRGPVALDQAKKNLGLPPKAVTLGDKDQHTQASGPTEEEDQERQVALDEAIRAAQPQPLREEPRHRTAEEAEEEEEMKRAAADQPGAGAASESERPHGRGSRW